MKSPPRWNWIKHVIQAYRSNDGPDALFRLFPEADTGELFRLLAMLSSRKLGLEILDLLEESGFDYVPEGFSEKLPSGLAIRIEDGLHIQTLKYKMMRFPMDGSIRKALGKLDFQATERSNIILFPRAM